MFLVGWLLSPIAGIVATIGLVMACGALISVGLAVVGLARGQGGAIRGAVAVCWVIKNRCAKRTGGPNLGSLSDGTIPGTVLRFGQFDGSSWKDPNFRQSLTLDDADPGYQRVYAAWRYALAGTSDPTEGALFYCVKGLNPVWRPYCTLTVTIGQHEFYRPVSTVIGMP